MTRLACHDLVHVYPGAVRALDGVSLTIDAGERVAIVGQNGSGKTTLVRHFNGLLRPTSGSVTVGELDAAATRIARLAAVVGMAFQDPDKQVFSRSVEAEVAFGARNVGLAGERLEQAVGAALAAVGLAGQRTTNPYDLGYSLRKLLTIASVLAMNTPVVILDEPTTGQDARGVGTIKAIIERLAGDGRTVVCISHDMRFVAEAFGRVVVMRQGTIVLDAAPQAVFAEAAWPVLQSTNLRPPYAALVGAQLALDRPTPTDGDLVAALRARRAAGGA